MPAATDVPINIHVPTYGRSTLTFFCHVPYVKLSTHVYVGIVFTSSTLLLFTYPVPADIQGSVQHVTLRYVREDVLPRLFMWFSQVKHLECHDIPPLQEVQCVHMCLGGTCHLYQSLFDRKWVELWGGRGCVEGNLVQ